MRQKPEAPAANKSIFLNLGSLVPNSVVAFNTCIQGLSGVTKSFFGIDKNAPISERNALTAWNVMNLAAFIVDPATSLTELIAGSILATGMYNLMTPRPANEIEFLSIEENNSNNEVGNPKSTECKKPPRNYMGQFYKFPADETPTQPYHDWAIVPYTK